MSGPDWRPQVRVAFIDADGTIDTTGQQAFGYFETLPDIGDVIVEPALLDDSPEAVVVVGRQYIKRREHEPRWWLIVRPAESGRWREICQLDDETDQAFAEMEEERHQDFIERMHREKLDKQRIRHEMSSARKALLPKGRQPRPRKSK